MGKIFYAPALSDSTTLFMFLASFFVSETKGLPGNLARGLDGLTGPRCGCSSTPKGNQPPLSNVGLAGWEFNVCLCLRRLIVCSWDGPMWFSRHVPQLLPWHGCPVFIRVAWRGARQLVLWLCGTLMERQVASPGRPSVPSMKPLLAWEVLAASCVPCRLAQVTLIC
jgi:hypothetical protein